LDKAGKPEPQECIQPIEGDYCFNDTGDKRQNSNACATICGQHSYNNGFNWDYSPCADLMTKEKKHNFKSLRIFQDNNGCLLRLDNAGTSPKLVPLKDKDGNPLCVGGK
jgi:hypothetical protein